MKRLIILVLSFICIFMSGCWDKVDIDENLFISTIGIDAGKDIANDKILADAKPEDPFGERQIEKLEVSFAYPDISQYSASSPKIQGSKLIETKAYSMEDAISNAVMKSSRNINLDQMRLLILGEDLLHQPDTVKEVIDFVARNPKLARTMYVISAQERIKDLLNFNLSSDNTIGTYITGLMESSKRSASILPVTLNEFLVLLGQNGNAIIPSIKIDKDKKELQVAGISIIKDYELKGTVSPQDTTTVELLRGKMKSGKKVIYKDEHPIDVEIDGVSRKVRLSEESGKLVFDIDLKLEGKIKDYYINKNIFDGNELTEIEQQFSKSLSEEGEKVSKRIQREYGVDIIGLREYVEKFKPKIWARIKDDWETNFKAATININADVEIRRIGIKK